MKKVPDLIIFVELLLCFLSIVFGILFMFTASLTFLYGVIAYQAISFCLIIYSLTQKNTK